MIRKRPGNAIPSAPVRATSAAATASSPLGRAGAALVCLLTLAPGAGAEDDAPKRAEGDSGSVSGSADERTQTIRLEEQRVEGEREVPRFLPDVDGVDIFAGKKTTVIDPSEPPKIVNDSYRQVLSRTPGLILSEESTPLVSIGYRGLDPHRTQFTLVLKDGIPIAADMFGYPENYYTPPIDSIERIDFVHGGAALLYGPQPGGALNFITKEPNPDAPISLYTNQTFGSDSYYSTYNALSGTVDRLGYYAYYYQKQGLGFREANSDFALYSGSAKATYAIDEQSSILLAFDGYNEEHGEPGGLRLTEAPGAALFQIDRNGTTRFFDRFRLKRYIGWSIYENEITEDTLVRVTAWGGYYNRYSKRQRGGGFGTLPMGESASTNSIEDQTFNTAGLDARVRQDWEAWGETNTLTAGIEYYHDTSPRVDERGATPDAESGAVRNDSVRNTNYGSLFAENRFVFGNLTLIPAVRFENFSEAVNETVNVDKQDAGVPLTNEAKYDFEPLVGFGATYTIWPTVEVYANTSSAYRPEVFTQAVPTSPTQIVAGNLQPGTSWQYEIGFRGYPVPFASWDTSFFWLDFDNQIGTVQLTENLSEIRNVGRSRHIGWELAAEIGALGMWDWVQGTQLVSQFGEAAVFANLMVLDAEFIAGPFDGKTPAFAPDYLVRAGVEYSLGDWLRAQLFTTASAQYFANDNNTEDFFVPAYNVWDLTMEANVYEETVGIYFGVSNLFDENYYARIRSDGIDPAYLRNFYGGVKVYF